jgi:hypothetical protein
MEEDEYIRMRELDEKAEKLLVEEKATWGNQIRNAQNGIAKGYDDKTIADITGLALAQVEQLRTEKG